MKYDINEYVQRELHFAIVDEVDSILIDEARTPLIISGPAESTTDSYYAVNNVVKLLKPDVHYKVDEKRKSADLTDEGINFVEAGLKVGNLYDIQNVDNLHYVNNALRAHAVFKLDVDYVVQNGEVIIVDEFTGRLMPGRRYSDGLHQALEAKEGVPVQNENQTYASITFQNYFRMYEKLAGMTGTALTEANEFKSIYDLEVVPVPTHKKVNRIDRPDVIYRTAEEKYEAIVKVISELNKKGQPVLVGTISIEKSELLSQLLQKAKIKHEVLNAKNHEREAEIVALAGKVGAVTIATNMAGRGTDIKLGQGVQELGGLFILGTERHESRRIDNQLRGRAARQGDPGSTRFFLSLEDNLMRIFGGDKITTLMNALNVEETMAIEHPLITRQIQSAQKKVETYHFDIRKSVLEYDDVMNIQREKFYAQRRKVLFGQDLSEDIYYMIGKEIERLIGSYIASDQNPEEYIFEDLQRMIKELHSIIPQLSYFTVNDIQGLRFDAIYNKLKDFAIQAYRTHEEEVINFYNDVVSKYDPDFVPQTPFSSNNVIRNLEKDILLRVVDNKWIDHLHNIDMLREGIGLRAYGQKDPLIEYKREAYDLFNKMMFEIQGDTVKHLFRTKFGIQVMNGPDEGLV